MGRLINADKLIEEIESYRGDIFADEIVNLIKQMPTVDVPDINVGEWIPVQGNVYPKDKGWYQCTCDDRKVGEQIFPKHTIVRNLFWNPNMKEFVDNIRYSENGHKDIGKYFWTKYVTAWQHLPEPYQADETYS